MKESLIDFDRYIISKDGNIYSKYWKKYLDGKKDKDGYVIVSLKTKDGKDGSFRQHRVIWYYFNGEIPDEFVVNHIDEDKSNNSLDNLNLLTKPQNNRWGTAIKRRAEKQTNNHNSKPIFQFTLTGELVNTYPSLNEVRRSGYDQGNICGCLKGRYKSSKGYIWKYENKF